MDKERQMRETTEKDNTMCGYPLWVDVGTICAQVSLYRGKQGSHGLSYVSDMHMRTILVHKTSLPDFLKCITQASSEVTLYRTINQLRSERPYSLFIFLSLPPPSRFQWRRRPRYCAAVLSKHASPSQCHLSRRPRYLIPSEDLLIRCASWPDLKSSSRFP